MSKYTLSDVYCIASGRKRRKKNLPPPSPFLSRQQAVSELRLICNYLEIIVCQNLANVTNIFRTCAVNYVRLLEDFLTLKVKKNYCWNTCVAELSIFWIGSGSRILIASAPCSYSRLNIVLFVNNSKLTLNINNLFTPHLKRNL